MQKSKKTAVKEWVKAHGIPVVIAFVLGALACHFGGPANAAEQPSLETRIVHAIGVIDGNAEDFTKAGPPRVRSLKRVLGFDVTAAQRDAAWDAYQARALPAEPALQAKLDAALEAFAVVSADKADLRANLEATTAAAGKQRARAEAAEAEVDRARGEAREANWRATNRVREANRRAATAEAAAKLAEAKTAALMSGLPVCSDERAVLAADESWRASSVRAKARKLLDCLAVGE